MSAPNVPHAAASPAPADHSTERASTLPLDSTTPTLHAESTVDDEKFVPSSRAASSSSQHSLPLPTNAPVLGAVGVVGEPAGKAEAAAEAFKQHPTETSGSQDEKLAIHEGDVPATGHATEQSAEGTMVSSKEAAEGDGVDGVVYPGGLQLGLLTLGLCLATFTMALDNTIIATAIPKITTVFDSLGDVGWYGSSYLLTTTALQPTFGRVFTYFDVKNTYLGALILFELGSVLCAAARNSIMLIVGRAVAGAGASAMYSGGMTIVGLTVPLAKRPLFIAALSSMFGISSVVGPLLGGALTDRVSWRWCFWINLPFGAVSLLAVGLFFKRPKQQLKKMSTKQKILEIDLLGALFLICAIVCLLLALQWGGSTYPWHNSKVWGCLLGFGLMISIFIAQQFRRGERATIPPRIFGQRTVLCACLYSCFMSMGLYTHIFYLPFYFQAVKGTTAEGSGIRTIPYLTSIIISSIVAGAGITVLGPYKPFMIFGSAVFTIGAGLMYTLAVTTGAGKWIGYQLLAGFGAGAGVQIPFVAVQVVLSTADMPTGNACAFFFNSLGGALSISIAQNIFSNGLYANIPKFAPGESAQNIISVGSTHLRQMVKPEDLPGVLQAYMLALNQAYVIPIVVGGIATVIACFVEWKSVKGKNIVAAAA